jgi:hypothetical protein
MLPLAFSSTTKEIYRVLTFWRLCRGTKVKYSLGKNNKDPDLIPEGKQIFRHKDWMYILPWKLHF